LPQKGASKNIKITLNETEQDFEKISNNHWIVSENNLSSKDCNLNYDNSSLTNKYSKANPPTFLTDEVYNQTNNIKLKIFNIKDFEAINEKTQKVIKNMNTNNKNKKRKNLNKFELLKDLLFFYFEAEEEFDLKIPINSPTPNKQDFENYFENSEKSLNSIILELGELSLNEAFKINDFTKFDENKHFESQIVNNIKDIKSLKLDSKIQILQKISEDVFTFKNSQLGLSDIIKIEDSNKINSKLSKNHIEKPENNSYQNEVFENIIKNDNKSNAIFSDNFNNNHQNYTKEYLTNYKADEEDYKIILTNNENSNSNKRHLNNSLNEINDSHNSLNNFFKKNSLNFRESKNISSIFVQDNLKSNTSSNNFIGQRINDEKDIKNQFNIYNSEEIQKVPKKIIEYPADFLNSIKKPNQINTFFNKNFELKNLKNWDFSLNNTLNNHNYKNDFTHNLDNGKNNNYFKDFNNNSFIKNLDNINSQTKSLLDVCNDMSNFFVNKRKIYDEENKNIDLSQKNFTFQLKENLEALEKCNSNNLFKNIRKEDLKFNEDNSTSGNNKKAQKALEGNNNTILNIYSNSIFNKFIDHSTDKKTDMYIELTITDDENSDQSFKTSKENKPNTNLDTINKNIECEVLLNKGSNKNENDLVNEILISFNSENFKNLEQTNSISSNKNIPNINEKNLIKYNQNIHENYNKDNTQKKNYEDKIKSNKKSYDFMGSRRKARIKKRTNYKDNLKNFLIDKSIPTLENHISNVHLCNLQNIKSLSESMFKLYSENKENNLNFIEYGYSKEYILRDMSYSSKLKDYYYSYLSNKSYIDYESFTNNIYKFISNDENKNNEDIKENNLFIKALDKNSIKMKHSEKQYLKSDENNRNLVINEIIRELLENVYGKITTKINSNKENKKIYLKHSFLNKTQNLNIDKSYEKCINSNNIEKKEKEENIFKVEKQDRFEITKKTSNFEKSLKISKEFLEENFKKLFSKPILNFKDYLNIYAKINENICQVCNNGDYQEENVFYFCIRCQLAVHANCYGIQDTKPDEFICDICNSFENYKENIFKVECILCPVTGGAMKRTNVRIESEYCKKLIKLRREKSENYNSFYSELSNCLRADRKKRNPDNLNFKENSNLNFNYQENLLLNLDAKNENKKTNCSKSFENKKLSNSFINSGCDIISNNVSRGFEKNIKNQYNFLNNHPNLKIYNNNYAFNDYNNLETQINNGAANSNLSILKSYDQLYEKGDFNLSEKNINFNKNNYNFKNECIFDSPKNEFSNVYENPFIIKIDSNNLTILNSNLNTSQNNFYSNENTNKIPYKEKNEEINNFYYKNFLNSNLSQKFVNNNNDNFNNNCIKRKDPLQNSKGNSLRFTWVHLSCALWNSQIHIVNFNKKEDFQSKNINLWFLKY